MDNRAKKKKAAIMAVMAFLEEEDNKKPANNWVRSGREMIMKNRQMAQMKFFK